MTPARKRASSIPVIGRAGALALFALLVAVAAAAPARAAEPYVFSVSVLGGVGGPLDADEPDPGTSQQTLELQLGLVTEPRTLLQLRVGRIDFDEDDRLGDVFSPQLEYATIAGEYRFYKNWYDSGVFLGLGGYRLSGDSSFVGGRSREETAVGITGGVTGEFEITQHFALLGQISGHYVDLDQSPIFATAMGGVSLRF
ncbi:MAG TPA: hypothetical protein VN923_03745 [Thermoanaerobaculia bacterium]|nr:hypothetical protein [Thermoanaerobaculia bacterium]